MLRIALRTLGIAVVVLVLLGGAGLWWASRNVVATAPVPPENRTAELASMRTLPGGGSVLGFVGRYGSHAWLGIPYAQPPVGELRWRAPQPPAPSNDKHEALAFGPICPQIASPFGGVYDVPQGSVAGDEDCLYLNVYAPAMTGSDAQDAGLPVMVWIHGGGNSVGHASFYDGGRLAQEQDVVVVTLNYRLGPLGWLRHPALRGAGTSADDQSGNFGTLDLVRALEWVRENVAGFGGDPANVTVFGESAGGRNVVSLLASPRAAGLFQRAIVQSGGLYTVPPADGERSVDDAPPGMPGNSADLVANLLVNEGRAQDRAAARQIAASMPADELARWLRGKTPEELFGGYGRDAFEGLLEFPDVFADGAVVPEGDLLARLATPDGWNRVPVMIGTTKHEDRLFLFADPRYVRRLLGVVPRVQDPDLFLATSDALATMWKATGADRPADAMWRTQPNVFVYRFDWDEEPALLGLDLGTYLGASHAFEIPFVFGHWDLGGQGNVIYRAENEAGREELAAKMMSYWAAFAADGDPGRGRRGELPAWTAWDGRPQAPKTMLLDTTAGGGVRMIDGTTTVEGVLATVESDARLDTQRERCWVYRELASRWRGITRDDYAARTECAAFPFDAFPWQG
ncbi:MAG: carboxylesterase [Proteobacteria bacterium]|nr:MAG: carboxylesterase [Pseudomonadota bacterium]